MPQRRDRRTVRRVFSFQILGRDDTAAFARDDGVRGLVKHDEQGLDRRAGIAVAELDERVDVGDTHVVDVRCQPADGFERAGGRGIDAHVEPFGLEVALVDGEEEGRRRSVDLAVEREVDGGAGIGRKRPHKRSEQCQTRERSKQGPARERGGRGQGGGSGEPREVDHGHARFPARFRQFARRPGASATTR